MQEILNPGRIAPRMVYKYQPRVNYLNQLWQLYPIIQILHVPEHHGQKFHRKTCLHRVPPASGPSSKVFVRAWNPAESRPTINTIDDEIRADDSTPWNLHPRRASFRPTSAWACHKQWTLNFIYRSYLFQHTFLTFLTLPFFIILTLSA